MNKIPLKELCKSGQVGKYGIPSSAEEYNECKTRYLRISDIDDVGNLLNTDLKSVSSDNIEKYILEDGDLVVARTGNSTGRAYLHESKNGRLAFAGFLIKYGLDPKKVVPKFLKYYTISSEYKQWVKNLSVGSTRGNINAQTFADCPISLPERKQQEILVTILSSLDSKIEHNNRINDNLPN
ncbi:MAG: restriction endonuclease subunit S [Paludibacteraceae bacterium]